MSVPESVAPETLRVKLAVAVSGGVSVDDSVFFVPVTVVPEKVWVPLSTPDRVCVNVGFVAVLIVDVNV